MKSRTMLVVGVLALGAFTASSSMGLPLFYGELNKLAGVPVATDESYIGTAAKVYKMPNGATPLGNIAGQQESIGFHPTGARGIFLPQPADLTGVPADPRSAVINPIFGTPTWGVRNGAVAQWQSITDGISTPLFPFGSVTSVFWNATPLKINAISATPTFDGTAPNSSALDAAPDFLPFVANPFGPGFIAVFQVEFADKQDFGGALGVDAAPGSAADIMSPKIRVFEDSTTLLDVSQVGKAYPNTLPGDNDADTRRLVETDFDHNTGTPIAGTSELLDASDGVLLLDGEVFDVAATLTFRTPTLAADSPITLDIAVQGKVDFIGGSIIGKVQPDVLGRKLGTFGATLTGINWANFNPGDAGADPASSAYDFAGFGSASADLSFDVIIPEPLTILCSVLAMGGLGTYARRRRMA